MAYPFVPMRRLRRRVDCFAVHESPFFSQDASVVASPSPRPFFKVPDFFFFFFTKKRSLKNVPILAPADHA